MLNLTRWIKLIFQSILFLQGPHTGDDAPSWAKAPAFYADQFALAGLEVEQVVRLNEQVQTPVQPSNRNHTPLTLNPLTSTLNQQHLTPNPQPST